MPQEILMRLLRTPQAAKVCLALSASSLRALGPSTWAKLRKNHQLASVVCESSAATVLNESIVFAARYCAHHLDCPSTPQHEAHKGVFWAGSLIRRDIETDTVFACTPRVGISVAATDLSSNPSSICLAATLRFLKNRCVIGSVPPSARSIAVLSWGRSTI